MLRLVVLVGSYPTTPEAYSTTVCIAPIKTFSGAGQNNDSSTSITTNNSSNSEMCNPPLPTLKLSAELCPPKPKLSLMATLGLTAGTTCPDQQNE